MSLGEHAGNIGRAKQKQRERERERENNLTAVLSYRMTESRKGYAPVLSRSRCCELLSNTVDGAVSLLL